jgi:hypothetical protein
MSIPYWNRLTPPRDRRIFFAKPLVPVVLDRRALAFSGGITQMPLAHYPDPSQAIILGQVLD